MAGGIPPLPFPMRNFIGIEIGGTKLQLVLGDEQARILERFRFPVNPEKGAGGIREQIQEALGKIPLRNVGGIGVGFGGPVDHRNGKTLASYQIDGWANFALQDWLEELAHMPVCIDNDANVAALGEALYGAGRDGQQVFYVTLGSGVGAGVVVNGKIYHGSKNTEAEFGHIRLDKSGRTVESSCSGWSVDAKIRAFIHQHPRSVLSLLGKDITRGEARLLVPALQQGDEAANKILRETADDLAFGLSHVVHLMNPHTIILGGGFSLIGEPLRGLVEEKLTGYIMDVLQPGPDIRLSALKEDVVPIGALTLAINQLTLA